MIFDRMKQLGKSTSHLLTLDEQKKLKQDFKKNPKFKDFQKNMPVLLDLPKENFQKETNPKVEYIIN